MVSLFLNSVEQDGKSGKDYKSMVGNTKPIRLFEAGYVPRIKLKRVGDKVFFTAQCQPETRLSTDYKMRIIVRSEPPVESKVAVVDRFLFTECSCSAGRGLHATCKHLSTILYALEEFAAWDICGIL